MVFSRWVRLDKSVVFEICDALANAASDLAASGRPSASLGRALALAEAGLAAGAVPRGARTSGG